MTDDELNELRHLGAFRGAPLTEIGALVQQGQPFRQAGLLETIMALAGGLSLALPGRGGVSRPPWLRVIRGGLTKKPATPPPMPSEGELFAQVRPFRRTQGGFPATPAESKWSAARPLETLRRDELYDAPTGATIVYQGQTWIKTAPEPMAPWVWAHDPIGIRTGSRRHPHEFPTAPPRQLTPVP